MSLGHYILGQFEALTTHNNIISKTRLPKLNISQNILCVPTLEMDDK